MALERKTKMLALEFSGKVIRGIEFLEGSSPLKILNFFSVKRPPGEPKEVARFLRETLEEEGIEAKRARVIFGDAECEHRLMILPRVPREEREALILRKLEEEMTVPVSELAVSHTVVGSVMERGVEKDEVLVVSTPLFEVRRLIFTLIEAGLEPVQVTTFPVAASSLHPVGEKDDYMSFLYLSKGKSYIVFSLEGKPRFSRDIAVDIETYKVPEELESYQSIGEVEEKNPLDERVVVEMTRSFLYFKQISRGGAPRRVYVLGDYVEESLRSLIYSRLTVEAVVGDALVSGLYDLVGRAGERATSFEPRRYAHLVGLAKEEYTREDVNILPLEYVERKKKALERVAYAGIVIVFIAVNVLLLGGLYTARKHYESIMSDLDRQILSLEEKRDYVNRITRLKTMAEESERILSDLSRGFLRWEEFFGLVALATPPSVTFDEMDITYEEGGYRVRLRGFVVGPTPEGVQKEANRFLKRVRLNPFLGGLSYVPEKVYPSKRFRGRYEETFFLVMNLPGEAAHD